MTIYIAGPIKNNPNYKEDFYGMASRLQNIPGVYAINPVEYCELLGITDNEDKCYRETLSLMVEKAHAIFLLPGWETSKGARNELDQANFFNFYVFTKIEEVYQQLGLKLRGIHAGF